MSEQIRLSEEELAQYGPAAFKNPMIIPRIAKAFGKIPEMMAADEASKNQAADVSAAEELLPDEPVFAEIAGLKIVRTLSAAMYSLLVKLHNPIICGTDKNGVPSKDIPEEEWIAHQGFILFLMSHPHVRDLVRWELNGTIEEEYMVWSYEVLKMENLMKAAENQKIDALIRSLNNANNEMETGDSEEGENTANPKSDGSPDTVK